MEPLDYLKKIKREGFEAYIVGGYVRDELLGLKTTDVDITTSATPKDVCKIFGITTGDELGCVNMKSSDLNVDITTYRKECDYIGHRPSSIVYVDDLLLDLKRRDFTVNTICMNSEGEIIDLLNGKIDLDNRLLRVVGEVDKKFSEDPLRMLRALRLSILYDFNINEEELIFILNNRELFKEISYERKKEELGKILVSNNCIKGLKLLKTLNLLDILEINFNDDIVYVEDYIGMWSQLYFSDKYPFTKIEHQRINHLRSILKYGKIDEMIILRYGKYDSLIAGSILGMDRADINDIYDQMQIHSIDELKISGKTIKELLDMDSSPKIKNIKNCLIREILSGNLSNDEQILKRYIIKKWK